MFCINKSEVLEIIRNSFFHLMYEEDIKIGSTEVLLYFPTIGIVIIEPKRDRPDILDNENVEDMDELYIKRELGARPIYLDLEEDDFNVGNIINDILLEASFAPSDDNFLEGRGN
ncbi:hypothetical protein ACFU1R_24835 [Priestia megaterium]|uniref:hypothetical protein n=1 Tax=Priestia megaterium TaxID=1404 RepID=UPI00366E284E